MTTYTADDFKNARFATNRDGRIAVRFSPGPVAADYPWAVIGSLSTVANPCVRDSHMTNAGWVPVQETPRPLTADDRSRAYEAFHEVWGRTGTLTREAVNAALDAALTPPPSRPEGAEGLADDLSGWDEMDDYGNRRFTHEELDDLADHLAARGWTKGEK